MDAARSIPAGKTRSVRTEIVAGFAAIVVAIALVGGFALWRQARAIESLRLQNQGYLPLSFALSEAFAAQTMMNTMLEGIEGRENRAVYRTWISSARRTRRGVILRARGYAEQARPDARAREDGALLAGVDRTLTEVERVYREDERAFGELFDALLANDLERARALHDPLLAREQRALDELRALKRAVGARMNALAAEAEQEQPRTFRVLSVATLVALLVGLATALSARRALRPLLLLRDRVRAVARGDLSPGAVPARPDEIGELAREFDNMVGQVKARDTSLREHAAAIRRAEEHLEQVVATLSAAVMVVAPDGSVQSVNPAAVRLSSSATRVGMAFAQTPFGALADVARAVQAACSGRADEAPRLGVELGERVLDVAVTPFAFPHGEGGGALVVADDVTERERARARVLQNERLAAIGRMAAHVTHEVRNPLSSMALNAEMLADEARALEGGSEVVRLAGAIQREIDRLTAITEEYLRMARLPKPRLEREDLGALVSDAVAFLAPELARANIETRVHVASDAPAALADESQIRPAIINLLRNAREALEGVSGARTLTVRVAPARGGVELAIADSGPGIKPEVRARLFELFFTTKERGSGLGLPLTREIIAAHGGSIEAGAAPAEDGGGARFVIWLPTAPVRERDEGAGGRRDAA